LRSSQEQVEQLLLRPMQATFSPPPRYRNPERALAAYARALRRFEPAVLRRAWEHLAGSHQRGRWPTLAQVIRHCESSAPDAAAAGRRAEPAWLDRERCAADYAAAFMQGALGQQATAEQWARRLQSFVQITAWQQLCRGAPMPEVAVPPERIAAWRLAWLNGIYDSDLAS